MREKKRHRSPSAAEPDEVPLGEVLDFMRLLWAIDHGLQKTSKLMGSTLGMTGPQRLALRLIGRFPGISAGRLAGILHLHPSTLTGVLHRLETRGWVERQRAPGDGRRALLGLTPLGRRLDTRTPGTIETAVEGALRKLTPAQVRAARLVLETLSLELREITR